MSVERATLGIDPGSSSGALAAITSDPKAVYTWSMPGTYLDIYRLLQTIKESYVLDKVVMEDVGGSRPGNSAKSARTFAEHVGALKMALLALNMPHVFVIPRKWMFDLFGHAYPSGSEAEQVKARKQYIYQKMQEAYPAFTFPAKQADAVAIAHWGLPRV